MPRRLAWAALALFAWLAVCNGAQAADAWTGFTAGPPVRVKAVGYAASFDLDTGERVRLLGIRAPKPDTPAFRKEAEPLGNEALAFVEEFVKGHTLTLYADANPRDRYGRLLAQVVRDDGVWLQQALLEHGLARVYSLPDNRRRVTELLAFEAAARTAQRGVWALPEYAVLTPETVGEHLDSFQIVEGRVTGQSRIRAPRDTIYLNFGRVWKTDFTIRIQPDDRPRFETRQGIPDWRNRKIRVRGWVFSHDGPMIEATHPEQIEIVE